MSLEFYVNGRGTQKTHQIMQKRREQISDGADEFPGNTTQRSINSQYREEEQN